MCIKTIDFVKHLHSNKRYGIVDNRVEQLPFIFFNMLKQVLSLLASFSTTTANIGLVERGDNGVHLNTAQLSKITKLVSQFFEWMDNHILEGSYPDTVPAFTPRDANPNHQVVSVIAMAHSGQHVAAEKSKPMCPLLALQLLIGSPKGRNSRRVLVWKTSQKLFIFTARKVPPILNHSPLILQQNNAVSFAFMTRSVLSPIRLVNLITLAGRTKFQPAPSWRSLNTAMPPKAKRLG